MALLTSLVRRAILGRLVRGAAFLDSCLPWGAGMGAMGAALLSLMGQGHFLGSSGAGACWHEYHPATDSPPPLGIAAAPCLIPEPGTTFPQSNFLLWRELLPGSDAEPSLCTLQPRRPGPQWPPAVTLSGGRGRKWNPLCWHGGVGPCAARCLLEMCAKSKGGRSRQ